MPEREKLAKAYQNNGYWGVTIGGHGVMHFGTQDEMRERAEREADKINREADAWRDAAVKEALEKVAAIFGSRCSFSQDDELCGLCKDCKDAEYIRSLSKEITNG